MKYFFVLTIFISSFLLQASSGNVISLTTDGKGWPRTLNLLDLQYRSLPGNTRLLTIGVRRAINPNMELTFEEVGEWGSHYKLMRGAVNLSGQEARSGNSSAGFQGNNPFYLQPEPGSIFRMDPQSFTIDFWVYPMRMSDGERVFEYSAMIDREGGSITQSIVADFEKGRIVWYFQNIFSDIRGNLIDLNLSGQPIVKNKWHRHTLRYESQLGMLEVLDNDNVTDVTHATPTRTESADVYEPNWRTAKQQLLVIGEFSGYLDDFRILPYYQDQFVNARYADRGSLITEPYDLRGKKFQSFKLVGQNERDSSFQTYLRFASYKSDFQYGNVPWQKYLSGEVYRGPTDRFVQFRVDFFAGIASQSSPVLRDMLITQEVVPPPPTPGRIIFEKRANGVLLKWSPIYTGNVTGYKVYFGDQPRNYFGDSASISSPVDVGNVTEYYLEGLTPGKLYYFSLTSYTDDPLRGESALAPETTYLP
ncbi:MAG: fibronectin type III domain-containing protein [Spirochaetia bacterium]